MTEWPRMIPIGRHLVPGLIAVVLFGILAVTFLTPDFADPEGFADVSIIRGIGYALIGEPAAAGSEVVYESTESFLVALILIGVLLDAALDGSLMLAKRDDGGEQK